MKRNEKRCFSDHFFDWWMGVTIFIATVVAIMGSIAAGNIRMGIVLWLCVFLMGGGGGLPFLIIFFRDKNRKDKIGDGQDGGHGGVILDSEGDGGVIKSRFSPTEDGKE